MSYTQNRMSASEPVVQVAFLTMGHINPFLKEWLYVNNLTWYYNYLTTLCGSDVD